ncbi:MAG: cytochrome c3 family protein [Gemmatimonadota bacterium]|nr:cytochrome c3 family protein [Gemmatimonadota bacterium]
MSNGRIVGILVLAAVLWSPLSAAAQQAIDQCATCHQALDEEHLSTPAIQWTGDVHRAAGLTCTGCHGGDAVATTEATGHAGMLASPPRGRIPELCGRCHSNQGFMHEYDPDIRIDQVEVYYTSRHGELLGRGDSNVAVCVDCHATHGIRSSEDVDSWTHPAKLPDTCGACHADNERMEEYRIPTDQLEEFKSSVHWAVLVDQGDLSSPVCNDCHGNHGALPPGYQAVGRVCAECHFQIGQYFALSPHDSVFVSAESPGCATCHGNHAIQLANDELLGLGELSTCGGAGCHSETDEGGQAAAQMLVLVDSLIRAQSRADSILTAAEHAGMPVDHPRFELAQVQNAIVVARAILHTAKLDSLRAKVDEGLTLSAAGFEAGQGAFAELRTRRTGLAVSAVFILFLILGLLMKIRHLETR